MHCLEVQEAQGLLHGWVIWHLMPDDLDFETIAMNGWPGVSILWLGEITSVCLDYLSTAACKIVQADPSLRMRSGMPEYTQHLAHGK